MTELEKIEFLMKLMKDTKFSLNLGEAHAFLGSYKWLMDKKEEIEKVDE